MKTLFTFYFLLSSFYLYSQVNKSGNAFIFGGGGIYAQFSGDTSRPTTHIKYLTGQPYYPHFFFAGSSSICDSVTGKLKILSNGYIVFDSVGNIMDNGDHLQPDSVYNHYYAPNVTQGSLILPKGSNGLYYLFTNTISNQLWDSLQSNNIFVWYWNLLQYHVIDMTQNGGLGKVVQKNIPLMQNANLNKVGMMACRHANGYDWWLLKQGGYDSTVIYKILVTADTAVIKDTQVFNFNIGYWDVAGQSAFSTNGKQYAYAMGKKNKLFLADFDRCSGELRHAKSINIPIDSTTDPFEISINRWDSLVHGVCFSPNDSFIYITRYYNIYQYELNNPDSATAWVRIKHGEDTTLQQFEAYTQLQRGVDGRIYIGKSAGTSNSNSVIDKPNLKGLACEFCRKCLRYNVPNTGTKTPSNMPDFTLGADSSGCWPLDTSHIIENETWSFYPNPASNKLQIINAKFQSEKKLYNSMGQLILTTTKNEIDISRLTRGLYFIYCNGSGKKVIIE